MKKYLLSKKTIFLIIFILTFNLIFNLLEGSAKNSSSMYLNEFITENPNQSSINSINNTAHKTNNPETLSIQTLYVEELKTNNSLWSENLLNLATFLTSIISLLTLNELRKQRYLANTPKLHIISPKNVVSIKNKTFSDIGKDLPTEWECENLNITKPCYKSLDSEPLPIFDGIFNFPPEYLIPLNVINTGSSPALNIKVTWSYDQEVMKNIMKQFNELKIGIEAEFSDSYGGDCIVISYKKGKSIFLKDLPPCNIDYIIPFSNLNNNTEILIPELFSKFITLKLCVLAMSESNNMHSIPSLNAEIAYYDNINILHKEDFSIEFKLGTLVTNKSKTEAGEIISKFTHAGFSIEAHKISEEKFSSKNVFKIIKNMLKIRRAGS